MSTADQVAINVQHLSKRFGKVEAVRDLTFTVAQGEIFGLVGPDGAGKTTAMRILAGILPHDAGTAEVAGVDLRRDPEAVKARIGYLSQVFSMYGDLTVAENMAFFADIYCIPYREAAERSSDLLAMTGLAPYADRLADNLSGGMQQKLALTCTLIHRPEVLLLDEPTTGVDPVSRRDFWRLLYGLPSQGVTLLVTTPYMDEAARCARLGVMHEGTLLACDTPEALAAGAARVVFEFHGEPLREAREVLRAHPDVTRVESCGRCLHAHSESDRLGAGALTAYLTQAGVRVDSLEPVVPGLEDAFIALLGRRLTEPAAPAGAADE